jgi:hypothetical protein
MNPRYGIQPWSPSPADECARLDAIGVPLLISVPSLASPARAPRSRRLNAVAPPRRRRIRREIRAACIAAAATLPIAFGAFLLLGDRVGKPLTGLSGLPRDSVAVGIETVQQSPAITISIDPTVFATPAEGEQPVVFPGYLLPDDGPEESAHAGS